MAQNHFPLYLGFIEYSNVLISGNKTHMNDNSASLNLCMISMLRIVRIYSEAFVNVIALREMFELE